MECDTDFTIKLTTDTKHSSLYKWCLQEFDVSGEQVGRDLIPWGWSLEFEATDLRYTYSFEKESSDRYRLDEELEKAEQESTDTEFKVFEGILATLVPAEGRFRRTSYSMMGTDREINDIHLHIEKAETDSCRLWGTVSYTFELDFRYETVDDFIDIHLCLTPDKFDQLAHMINSGAADGATLRLSGVRGFYSDWSPEISTDFIKVLTPAESDHMVETQENADIDPPRLGTVGDFRFSLNGNQRLKGAGGEGTDAVDYKWAKKQAEAQVISISTDYENEDEDDDEYGEKSGSLNEERAQALRRSLKYQLLTEMLRELSHHGAKNNLERDSLDDLSYQITSFFGSLEIAFQKDWMMDHENDPDALSEFHQRTWQLWQHRQIRFDEIKKGEVPHVDRGSLTTAVGEYLNLPIRNKRIDRMLVDALVAAEVIAFADQMLNIPNFLKDLSASPFIKSHPLWRFIKAQFANFVLVAAIPIGLLVGAVEMFDIHGEWPFFIGLGFAGLWALFFVIGLIALPSFWISETRRKRKVGELLEAMHTVHTEIGTGVVVSARHVRERLDSTADIGAVWPSEVFPLLDDIIDRGGVL